MRNWDQTRILIRYRPDVFDRDRYVYALYCSRGGEFWMVKKLLLSYILKKWDSELGAIEAAVKERGRILSQREAKKIFPDHPDRIYKSKKP